MLLTKRKLGEKIFIQVPRSVHLGGERNITITITDIKDGEVILGVQTPRDVAVYRIVPETPEGTPTEHAQSACQPEKKGMEKS